MVASGLKMACGYPVIIQLLVWSHILKAKLTTFNFKFPFKIVNEELSRGDLT